MKRYRYTVEVELAVDDHNAGRELLRRTLAQLGAPEAVVTRFLETHRIRDEAPAIVRDRMACPSCGQNVAITKGGRIPPHGRTGARCLASGGTVADAIKLGVRSL